MHSYIKDWNTEFPQLFPFRTTDLLKVSGPVMYGINLAKIFPTTYRPTFVIYNLASELSKPLIPVVSMLLKGKNNTQVCIKVEKHSKEFLDACDLMRHQALLNFDEEPLVIDIINAINSFLQFDYIKGTNSFERYKGILLLSKFLGDHKLERVITNDAINNLKKYPTNILKAETGELDSWIENIRGVSIADIIARVTTNLKKLKVNQPNQTLKADNTRTSSVDAGSDEGVAV